MELEAANRQAQLVRMDEHDRISQSSSVATISYFPVHRETDRNVRTFGKRCQAAKRDPNCPVVIRGWLNKKDSSGLKLWKRRWFVLSNYCLFYYKDSREESVLGSIPLPSYKILFCTPRECKNRKFTFKVVHQGMRSYFFSADTQEDMLGWVRALSQSATMETDGSLNRRCSSYQDFTKIGGSSESVDLPRPTSDEEDPTQKHRHISRTLSEPSHLTIGRMWMPHSEHRGRRSVHHRNSRTPSPPDLNRRRACGPSQEEDSLPGRSVSPPPAEMMGPGSLLSRGQMGSRPHTPVGRVDIRPHDDSTTVPQTLYYTPASPKLEFKSTPNTPVTEKWQNLSKPTPTYGSVHHVSGGRRPLGKSYSSGAHADLLPPLPPSSRASHVPHHPHHHHHHHHHRSNISVSVLPPAMAPKPELKEAPPIRPLESDADAVLTRLCGCDKLLQALSVELAQLQMDKDGVHCALEVSRLQLEEWENQGPRAQEEALTQKALLQEELVTIRARMCDVSLEMERVWSQYERMESELSVIRSHLQHICNFGVPQEQSQAQRELWMMEDILAGLKINRDHFGFLLGLQKHRTFQPTAPHPGSPGSPTEGLQSRLTLDVEKEPPVRPPLPEQLQESPRRMDHVWTELPYEGIYSHPVDAVDRRGNNKTDLHTMKAQKDSFESQPGSKWIPPDKTSQSTKKMKMSEEEQIERMKRNQERLTNRKKSTISTPGGHSQGSETREEAPFPLRVTRVVTAVLPSSLVARRVSVEDPPPELNNPLPEQIQPELQQRSSVQSKKLFNKPPRRLLLENPDQIRPSAETCQDQSVIKTDRQQKDQGAIRASKESRSEASSTEPVETSRNHAQDQAANRVVSLNVKAEQQPSALPTPDMDADLCLTPEQRDAKLRRVERIRERVIRSAVRESSAVHNHLPTAGKGKNAHQVPLDTARKQKLRSDHNSYHVYESCGDNIRGPAELQISSGASREDKKDGHGKTSKNQVRFGNKTQHKDHIGITGVAKTKLRRPASPYHISSMTVYQKDGGKGFTSPKNGGEEKPEEPATGDNESNFSFIDLRAKWFLSTNQWQGFMPLQIPDIDCTDEISDIGTHPACTDDVTDSNKISSTVSESLEKMKENHSLFYKIACDISISDTDIAKNDENSNGPTSPRPEEEEELVITESLPKEAVHTFGISSNQESKNSNLHCNETSASTNNKFQDLTPETQRKREKEGPQIENEETRRPEDQLEKVKETAHGYPVPDTDCDHSLDGNAKTREEECEAKEMENRKVDQKKCEEGKKCRSLSEESRETVEERDYSMAPTSSVYTGGSMNRSASFGKARVTVLRTSL